MDLHKSVMKGRYLSVQPARSRQRQSSGTARARPSGCRTLFVKNLPYTLTEQTFGTAFAQYGSVENARLARWGHTGRLKGFGYVTFAHGSAAEKAMADAANIKIGGRSINMDYDTGAPKSSFKTAEGRQWTKMHSSTAEGLATAGAEPTQKKRRGHAAAEERKASKAAAAATHKFRWLIMLGTG